MYLFHLNKLFLFKRKLSQTSLRLLILQTLDQFKRLEYSIQQHISGKKTSTRQMAWHLRIK